MSEDAEERDQSTVPSIEDDDALWADYRRIRQHFGASDRVRIEDLKRDFLEDMARRDSDFKRLYKEAFKEMMTEQLQNIVSMIGTGVLKLLLALFKMLLIAAVGVAILFLFKLNGWRPPGAPPILPLPPIVR